MILPSTSCALKTAVVSCFPLCGILSQCWKPLKYIVLFLPSSWLCSPLSWIVCFVVPRGAVNIESRCYSGLHSCGSCMAPDKLTTLHGVPGGSSRLPEGHLLEEAVGKYCNVLLPGDCKCNPQPS